MHSSKGELPLHKSNCTKNSSLPFGSLVKKPCFVLVVLAFCYLLIHSSQRWLPNFTTITLPLIRPRWGGDSLVEKQPKKTFVGLGKTGNGIKSDGPKGSASAIPERTEVSVIKWLAILKVKLVALRSYKDCYLIFEEDVDKLESALDSPWMKKKFSTSKKVGLDARSFHWEKARHKEEQIVFKFTVQSSDEAVFISVVYRRGKEDKIDAGFYWIPSFGKQGKAKAFSRFQTDTNDDGITVRPANETIFEWEDKAAEFQECDYARVKKFYDRFGVEVATESTINAFMATTVHLRKLLASWGVHNWIISGSLLGWFRQCGAIPYTTDADTASWASDYQGWMKDYFLKTEKTLHLWRKYGRKNDSLEMTFTAKGCRIDLFFMYEGVNPPKNKAVPSGKNQSYVWLGLQTFDDYKKGKEIFPPYRRLCTAELHGYLVNIPCNVEELVKAEYGPEKWFKPDKHFNYVSSPYNIVIDGRWKPKEWDGGEVYEKH